MATNYIHPLVMFSIIEAWNYRPEESTDVIGLLLGTRQQNGSITLHEAHYLQHTVVREPVIDIQCDVQRVNTISMNARDSKAKLEIVGWFTTYTQLDAVHRIVHNHFANTYDIPNFCLLTVDVTLAQNTFAQTLYLHNNTQVSQSGGDAAIADAQLTCFTKAPLQTIIPTQERLALHAILTGNPQGDDVDAPVAVQSNAQQIRQSVFGDLHDSIKQSLDYVNLVLSGKIPGDEQIGKQLAYICANIPLFDQETSDSLLNESLAELKMFSSFAQITKSTVSGAQFVQKDGPIPQ